MTQKEFYRSAAWRKLAKLFLSSKNYICERCGEPASIAHHKVYLTPTNFRNIEISLNTENLEALCFKCHNTEHFKKNGAIKQGLLFDENGDIIEER